MASAQKQCSILGCEGEHSALGYCRNHYQKFKRTGSPHGSSLPPGERFWSQVEKTAGCWQWTGSIQSKGYGHIVWDGKTQMAHRVSYEMHRGGIPEGLVIDHLCRNRSCVNPDHMEAVTNRVNVLRGVGLTSQNALKTECARGHLLDEANTYTRPSGGGRSCRKCRAKADRKSKAKRSVRG